MTREEAKNFLIDISYKLGNMAIEYLTEKDGEKMREAIKALEQEPKTGHWIRWYEKISYENSTEYNPHCKCSECNTEYNPHTSQFIKYCNVCGAKMESEVSE